MKNGFFTLILFMLCVCAIGGTSIRAQTFLNADLNGTVCISCAPNSWQQVPFGDPNSNSTSTAQSTSDVTGWTGPQASGGIMGNPYSGNSFTTGLTGQGFGLLWDEGIMQTVSGFVPGNNYEIHLYQAVIKQSNAQDNTGGWQVILDNTTIANTAASTSTMPYNSTAHPWELRTVVFTALSNTHTIKFLPQDNDANIDLASNVNAVRMGIDSVWITEPQILPLSIPIAVTRNGTAADISWEAHEIGPLESFSVERSADGYAFETLHTTEADHIGTYIHQDPSPHRDASFYRIAALDKNGGTVYSEVAHIGTPPVIRVFAAGNTLYIRSEDPEKRHDVQLFDVRGQQVFADRVADTQTLDHIVPGVYLAKVRIAGQAHTVIHKKVMLGY